jgi:hypothetical protein
MRAGYSGTALAKKLGIKPGSIVYAMSAPREYRSWLAPFPENARLVMKAPSSGADIVHVFVKSLAEFAGQLPRARKAMKVEGAIWVSWYKKSAGIPTDVTEDLIRKAAMKTDLVDVKVCAVTDEWSGLRLVVRKHLR